MRGEFILVWPEMWREVWKKLSDHHAAPDDIFCELFREIEEYFKERLDQATELAAIVDDKERAKNSFRKIKANQIRNESSLVKFLCSCFSKIDEYGGDELSNRYFILVQNFIEKYNLRYDLRRPFTLHPTLIGMHASLLRDLKNISTTDHHLNQLMIEFEDAIRDLDLGTTQGRIKNCLLKQFNLLEALTSKSVGVKETTLGKMIDDLKSWPHPTVRDAAKKLYGFRAYPGIGHGGQPNGVLRDIDTKDLIAITVLLSGLTPYLIDTIDPDRVFRGDES